MKDHFITWINKTTGVKGKGSLLLTKEDAERLAVELNTDHPNFQHTATLCELQKPSKPE